MDGTKIPVPIKCGWPEVRNEKNFQVLKMREKKRGNAYEQNQRRSEEVANLGSFIQDSKV